MKAESTYSLKDDLFNREKVEYLAGLLAGAHQDFAAATFIEDCVSRFDELGLKERIAHIANMLHEHLPEYPEALAIILDALPEPLDPDLKDDDFGDFIFAPLSAYVAENGCTDEHLSRSLDALREITKRFSAEDAIRTFIDAYPEDTLEFLLECAQDSNYHVRRLASEGTRPRLPWSKRLSIEVERPIPILDLLYADPTRYVTRSVANHLNDIAKSDPDLVVETLCRWKADGEQDRDEFEFIMKHSLRTLVKKGHPPALELLGFHGAPDVELREFAIHTPVVELGLSLEFSLEVEANRHEKLLVDWVLHFATDGERESEKVYKLRQLELEAGESVTLEKTHPMRPMTTRRLYAGVHRVTLQINGVRRDSREFELRL